MPISEAMTQRGADAAASMVTDEILDKVVVAGTPEEVAALAVYLASDAAAFTTGQIHVIDGGWAN